MSTEPKRDRIDWADVPIVFVTMPTCPLCGATAYDRTKTEAGGDGSRTKKVHCRDCGEPYKICVELPESGDGEL